MFSLFYNKNDISDELLEYVKVILYYSRLDTSTNCNKKVVFLPMFYKHIHFSWCQNLNNPFNYEWLGGLLVSSIDKTYLVYTKNQMMS